MHRLPQGLAQSAQEPLLAPQVDDVDRRHGPALDPAGHRQPRVAPAIGVVPALERGSGRAQEHGHALELGPLHGHVARVVSRDGFLLERPFMFLVDDDQPQPSRRGEDRRPGADDDLDPAGGDALPVAMPLDVAEVAVQHRHPVEPPAEPADRLGRQADLGDQHDRLASPGDHLLDRREVDLGLAAAGDPVDQEGGERVSLQGRSQCRHGRLLLARQHQPGRARRTRRGCRPRRRRRRFSVAWLRPGLRGTVELEREPAAHRVHQALPSQRQDRGARAPGSPADVREGRAAPSVLHSTSSAAACLGESLGLSACSFERLPGFLGDEQERADPGAGLVPDSRRHRRIQGLAPRAHVILGHPARERQHPVVDQRDGIEHLRDVLELPRIQALRRGQRRCSRNSPRPGGCPCPAAPGRAGPAGSCGSAAAAARYVSTWSIGRLTTTPTNEAPGSSLSPSSSPNQAAWISPGAVSSDWPSPSIMIDKAHHSGLSSKAVGVP